MIRVKYICNNMDCNNFIKKIFKNKKDIKGFLDCGQCGIGKLVRVLSAPSSNSVEYVDNGLQARKVRVMAEVVEQEKNKEK